MYKTTFIKLSLGLFFCISLVSACKPTPKENHYSIFAFGTLIDVTLYGVESERAAQAFLQLQQDFDRFHQDWSPWTHGDLAQLNTKLSQICANTQNTNLINASPINLAPHLVPLIQQSFRLSEQSEGLYNPTIGHLINLWQFHKSDEAGAHPPEAEKVKNLVAHNPKMSNLTLTKNHQLLCTNPAVRLNFGAFAKGYAIALEMEKLRKLNIENAIINAGGDLSVMGQHGKRAWNIGIIHPRQKGFLASIEAKDGESIFTSGDYERFYLYQNKRFHHILDPRTGYPAQGAQSVTVITKDAALADAAATALLIAGKNDWQNIAKKMGVRLILLVDYIGNIHLTPAMQKRVTFLNKKVAKHIIISQPL